MNLDKLNDKQREAILTTEGPVLILAGAGSGKTTVLVNRIAYILDKKLATPQGILAITFTNKAANEMKTRVADLIGDAIGSMWISTFHSACVKILRSCIDKIGFTKNFVIYDSDDSKTLVKECIKELNLDDKIFTPRSVLSQISKAKDEMISAEEYAVQNFKDYRLSRIAGVYELYQNKLKKNNALDFDDIVYFTVKIFKEYPEILNIYQSRFSYIMVDEYQDTSTVQYMLISLLSAKKRNICVVGDDDQSIYKFRGANIRNILDFEKEFSDAVTIKLEQNYRSTKCILNAANTVIKNNSERKSKALWTDNDYGKKIEIFTGYDEREEAKFISNKISSAVENGAKYSDFAVLYRTNAQSRVIEDSFIRNVVPYRVLSGLRFYDRKEIKDIIAYLRLILNPSDDISLLRVINEPKRGIGKTTMEKVAFLAQLHSKSLFEIISQAQNYPDISRSASKFKGFCDMIFDLRKIKDSTSIINLIDRTLKESGYSTALELEKTVESETRLENIKEFFSVAAEFEKNEDDTSFEAFLENIALVSNIDFYDEDEDFVVMMTIHSAKGLEFEKVFLVGMEEGIFPSLKGMSEEQDREDLEEERRLCYVAITRAKSELYISNAQQRTIYGKSTYQTHSRFIGELHREEVVNAPKSPISATNQFIHEAKQKINCIKNINPINRLADNTGEFETDFDKGDIVYHKKFGRGLVINSKKYGKDTLVEVVFDTAGQKQLMANFAKLTKNKQ